MSVTETAVRFSGHSGSDTYPLPDDPQVKTPALPKPRHWTQILRGSGAEPRAVTERVLRIPAEHVSVPCASRFAPSASACSLLGVCPDASAGAAVRTTTGAINTEATVGLIHMVFS
jgi:hypothetical protein